MTKTTKKKDNDDTIISVTEVNTGTFECCVVGLTPFVTNAMSEKVRQELLYPKGRKSAFDRATTLKHDPVEEFRNSTYKTSDPTFPTLITMLATAFKGALCSAALDMPGTKKAQIGRLTWVQGEFVPIFGIPKLFMRVVRMADMSHTPDVRTRAILPEWATTLRLTYARPLITGQTVANLLAAAGLIVGVGDGRQEKGKLNYGQFRLTTPDDPDFVRITTTGGRDAQIAAMKDPVCYDDESTSLLGWFENERIVRKGKGSAAA